MNTSKSLTTNLFGFKTYILLQFLICLLVDNSRANLDKEIIELENKLEQAVTKILAYTKFEMPYKIEKHDLYEREKPKGFNEDL